MPDLQEPAADLDQSPTDAACDEIAKSLGSVWAKYSGARPKSNSVEIEPHVVRWAIEEGVPDESEDGEDAAPADPELSVDSTSFQHTASATVARAMKRRVAAFIPKHDKKTDVFTHTFILARLRQKF
jgi:hypothetical protein